jgi:hypothetical protein
MSIAARDRLETARALAQVRAEREGVAMTIWHDSRHYRIRRADEPPPAACWTKWGRVDPPGIESRPGGPR